MTDLAAARSNMVDRQVRTADVTDLRIQDAMLTLPRENFAPVGKAYLAYTDTALEYAPGRALLKPRDVAKLLQAAKPVVGEKVLAIAAPYAAAVLASMGAGVVRYDGDDLLAIPGGPFDLIVVEGAVALAPKAWLDALAFGGRLAWWSGTGRLERPVFMCGAPMVWGVACCLMQRRRFWRAVKFRQDLPFRHRHSL